MVKMHTLAVGIQDGGGVVATGCIDVGKPAEAPRGTPAEHHTNPISAQPETPDWTDPRVKRRDRQSRLARRSTVIWGVPAELSTLEIKLYLAHKKADLLRGAAVTWEGAGAGRHVEIRYPTRSRCTTALNELIKTCKELRWRATAARDYQQRTQRRPTAATPTPIPTSNPFEELAESSSTTAADLSSNSSNSSDNSNSRSTSRDLPKDPKDPKETRRERGGVNREREKDKRESERVRQRANEAPRAVRRPGLRAGSLNTQGRLRDKVHELESKFRELRLDVVAIQETRLGPGDGVVVHGYAVLRPPKEDARPGGGVATLVALHAASHASVLEQKCENQFWIQLGGSGSQQPVYICNAYMPQANDKKARDAAFEHLEESVIFYRKLGCVIVLGDLNARLGPDAGPLPRVGPHTDIASNDSSNLLSSLLSSGQLINLGGQSKPPLGDFWHTRLGPNGTKSMIDYVLLDDRFHHNAEFGVSYDHLESDHYLLWAEVKSIWQSAPEVTKPKKRFRLERFDPFHTDADGLPTAVKATSKFQQLLASLFEGWAPVPGESVESVTTAFTKKLFEALEGAVGSSTRSKKFSRGFFDSEVRAAIDARRKAHTMYSATSPGSAEARRAWNKFADARQSTRELVAKKKQREFQSFADKVTSSADASNMKLCWSLLERLKPCKAGRVPTPVRRADGTLAKSLADRLETWAGYQKSLATPVDDPTFDNQFGDAASKRVASIGREAVEAPPLFDPLYCLCPGACECRPPLGADFTLQEVEAAVARARPGKASGPDLTRNEMFKAGGFIMSELLLTLFNFINNAAQVPAEWQKANVANLHKEGDPCDPQNYRGISLISCLGKIYLSVWADRLTQHMESRMSEEQGGFRPKRSTIDQGFSLHEVLLRRRNAGNHTFLYFVDFKKAFDTVWHDGLWLRLHSVGIRGRPLKILQSLYSNIRQSVLVDGQQTEYIRASQGVRQGCPISPVLFSIFIEEMVHELRKGGVGVKLDAQLMFALLYADDAVLLAESAEDLQKMINIVDGYCKKWRMLINLTKSEAMVIPQQVPGRSAAEVVESMKLKLTIRSRPVPLVTKYKYLGIWIQQDLGWKLHVAHNVSKAKAKHAAIGGILRCGAIPTALKRLVWCAVVRSRLEYGAELVTLSKGLVSSLESVQHWGLTTILRTNRHASKLAVNVVLGLPSIEARFAQKRLAYLGKIQDLEPTRWPRRVYDLDPNFKVKLKGPRLPQWRTHSLSLVKAAKLGADLGKPTWPAAVRRWAAAHDREKVISAEENAVPVAARSRRSGTDYTTSTHSRSSLAFVARAIRISWKPGHPFPAALRKRDGASQLAVRLLCGTHSLRSMAHIGDDDRCPRCDQKESVMHFLTAHRGRAVQKFETVVSERCFCGCGRGLTPRCLERFRALEEDDKLLIMLGGPLSAMAGPCCLADPEVGNAAMALLAEMWDARNVALSDLAEAQASPPALTGLFAFGFTAEPTRPKVTVTAPAPHPANGEGPQRKASVKRDACAWGEFVPLAADECVVRSVSELRGIFRDEVRLSVTQSTPSPPSPTHAALPAPPRPTWSPRFPALIQEGRRHPSAYRSGLLSVGCQSAPPEGVEAHGAVGPTDFLSPAET